MAPDCRSPMIHRSGIVEAWRGGIAESNFSVLA
jgi:hypothetical protein